MCLSLRKNNGFFLNLAPKVHNRRWGRMVVQFQQFCKMQFLTRWFKSAQIVEPDNEYKRDQNMRLQTPEQIESHQGGTPRATRKRTGNLCKSKPQVQIRDRRNPRAWGPSEPVPRRLEQLISAVHPEVGRHTTLTSSSITLQQLLLVSSLPTDRLIAAE